MSRKGSIVALAETPDEDTSEVESLDGPDASDEGEQSEPLVIAPAERKLVTQPYDLGVRSIREDIRSERISLNISYQRKYVWDSGKASRLIESLLLNVPIPVCYFAEDEEGVYEVIDGLQRLTTIQRYLDNEFALAGVSVLSELNGTKFDDLSPKDRRRLESRTIRCIVITADSHPDIKFDVFERLNTGAARLTAQELRNSVYRGNFNTSIKALCKEDYFTSLVGNSAGKRMEHEELVLRFFALVEGIENYRPPLRQLLNKYMRYHRHDVVNDDSAALFESVCSSVSLVFGEKPFQAPGSKNPVNKALFDALMVSVAYCDRNELEAHSNGAAGIVSELSEDAQFKVAIGRATADRSRVLYRIAAFTEKLTSLGIPSTLPSEVVEEGLNRRGA